MHAPTDRSFLEKWHGAGNDFLVCFRDGDHPALGGAHARRWCDRHTGVGADGLVEARLGAGGLEMVLHNADGSRAELSGNGLRCLVAAAAAHGLVPEGALDVATGAGPRRVTIALEPGAERAWGSVDMGEVTLVDAGDLATGVRASIGNPHVVITDPGGTDDALIALAAPLVAGLEEGANVEFVTVVSADRAAIRVVERGVGLTLACGTGSCATAAVLHRLGLVGPRVTVANPGGDLDVTLEATRATLAGPAVKVASIALSGQL